MLYFVYPYEPSKWNEELKYSLRSLELNFREEFSVMVIGREYPTWLKPEYFIRVKQLSEDRYVRVGETYTWIMNNLKENFFLCADDQYLLKPSSLSDLSKIYYIENLTHRKRPQDEQLTLWMTKLWDTIYRLRQLGILNIYNYATHIPHYMNPIIIKEMWKEFKFSEGIHLLTQAYDNFCRVINPEFLTIKAGFYGLSDERIEDHHVWLNHNDKGLNDDLKNEITNRFSLLSRFER